MITSVPCHDFRTDNAAEAMAPLIDGTRRVLDRLERPEMSRRRALSSTLTMAKWRCLTDPEAAGLETWEAWVTAMQVGSALFDSATAAEGPVPCRIGSAGEVKNLPATGPTPYTHAGAWLTSVYLATICRENDRLDRLMQVPVSFLRASVPEGAVLDDHVYDWVEALQSYWAGRATEMWDKLVSAVKGTDPEREGVTDKETMLKILYPPLELFHRFQLREIDQFNTALVDAATGHKQFWAGDPARALSGDGLVALAPLALACMAYDNEFPVKVESEYLPKHLLRRSWVGEFET
ncbi:immunity 49 family protein [Streptomyces prasinus]|uniref:immunity 49 family protein n=1 Tax=Streptomyces prasinus TaxID=67345 RepID=UPI000ABBDC13|nr:immunity 49 family protein [Streptomyces prasinus]